MPIACLAILAAIVFLVAWLWLAKGVKEAEIPNIVAGDISQCVYSLLSLISSEGSIAIILFSSSIASIYSTRPFLTS